MPVEFITSDLDTPTIRDIPNSRSATPPPMESAAAFCAPKRRNREENAAFFQVLGKMHINAALLRIISTTIRNARGIPTVSRTAS